MVRTRARNKVDRVKAAMNNATNLKPTQTAQQPPKKAPTRAQDSGQQPLPPQLTSTPQQLYYLHKHERTRTTRPQVSLDSCPIRYFYRKLTLRSSFLTVCFPTDCDSTNTCHFNPSREPLWWNSTSIMLLEPVTIWRPWPIKGTMMGKWIDRWLDCWKTRRIEQPSNTCFLLTSSFSILQYSRVIFHRVISDFMIQGGDPSGTGRGYVMLLC